MAKRKKKSATQPLTGRPTQSQSAQLEERLRRAAVALFLERGFALTSMEAVARVAHITKRTLYARYPNKEALFADAMVWASALSHSTDLPKDIAEWGLVEGLTEIARVALARALDPDIVRLSRVAMVEARRLPEFSTYAYSTIWSPRVKAVVDLLTRHKRAGSIRVDDVTMAAEAFLAMAVQSPMWFAMFDQQRPLDIQHRHLEYAVGLFILALRKGSQRLT